MVAVEAAAHGLPTVAFNAGGVSDAVREGVSGRLIEPYDYPAFANAVLSILNQGDADITDETCRAHARQFSWEKYGADLRDLLVVPLSPPPFS
jgi:phosphatidylinositol alpha-1,6-mannosyltransferase